MLINNIARLNGQHQDQHQHQEQNQNQNQNQIQELEGPKQGNGCRPKSDKFKSEVLTATFIAAASAAT
uniref:GG11628 n=1 Tax=Drosophila erecta TaxID=7220 RepID=B3P5N4_DROER